MRVDVLYFGVLRESLGADRAQIELENGVDVGTLLLPLRGTSSNEASAGGVWESLAVAVNRVYAGRTTILNDGDEVALLPPVSGGKEESRAR